MACRWASPEGESGGLFQSGRTYDDVVMTPAVANLTDDNGDGKTDRLDMPDLVFVSFDHPKDGCCTGKGILRVVSGGCVPGADPTAPGSLRTIFSYMGHYVDNSSGVALGNLHPAENVAEHPPEIVVTARRRRNGPFNGTVALRRVKDDGSEWEEMWRSDQPDEAHGAEDRGVQPAIADAMATENLKSSWATSS
jgi:hypothetical protein